MEVAFISSITAVLVPPFLFRLLIIYLVGIQTISKKRKGGLLIWGTGAYYKKDIRGCDTFFNCFVLTITSATRKLLQRNRN